MSNDDNTNSRLYENHRRTIGVNFMKELCEKHDDAKRRGESTMFTIDELWKDNDDLSSFDQDQIAPLVIRFFRDELGYIIQYPDKRISITDKGRQHCGDPDESFTLSERYQPSKRDEK
jgi:hypothetical protein